MPASPAASTSRIVSSVLPALAAINSDGGGTASSGCEHAGAGATTPAHVFVLLVEPQALWSGDGTVWLG